MTEKELQLKDRLGYDFHILGNAQVAESYLKQGDKGLPLAKKCLEQIIKDTKKTTWADNLIYDKDPAIIQKVIKSQIQTYYQVQQTQSIEDVVNYYSSDIISFIGDKNIDDLKRELGDTLNKNYLKILNEIAYAEKVIDDKKNFPDKIGDDEVKKAEETIKRYQIVGWISNIEQNKLSQFKYKVEQEAYNESMREAYKEMHKYKKEESEKLNKAKYE